MLKISSYKKYSILILIIKYIEINDLISLIFILSFNSLILFINKFNDNLRFYIDYRALNHMIIKNHYSISLITEIMNQIKNIKYFIKFNIYNIFNYIYIAKKDEYKIIFYIKYNHFKYLIILFNLCNTSIIFQL